MGGSRGRLISTLDRQKAYDLITEAVRNGASVESACKQLQIDKSSYYNWRKKLQTTGKLDDGRTSAQHPVPANKLLGEELEPIDKALAENPDLSPAQLVAKLADNGIYLASESTIYRRLRSRNMCHQRGRIRKRKSSPISSHSATAPNQVWMWDITYLIGPTRGVFHYLYLISDLFSRYIVGWGIWPEQSADHSSELIKKAYLEQKGSAVIKMVRYEVGEGMEKRNDDFASEVMSQIANA